MKNVRKPNIAKTAMSIFAALALFLAASCTEPTKCWHCDGTGALTEWKGEDYGICPWCGGTGYIY